MARHIINTRFRVALVTLLFGISGAAAYAATEDDKITADVTTTANANFGFSVAVSGTTVVVGALGNNLAGTFAGSAYVYDCSSFPCVQVSKLIASDAASGDTFGYSVAVSGANAIVGAINDGGNATGAAYYFDLSSCGPTCTETSKLTASDATGSSFFGIRTAISGTIAVVGVFRNDNDAGFDAGVAYYFDLSTCGVACTETGKLTASDAAAGDKFGLSVAISGITAVVGAVFDDDETGSAYYFDLSTCGVACTETGKLTVSDAASGDAFGGSVAISGTTVVVGSEVPSVESAYYFDLSTCGAACTETGKLTASDVASDDTFGYSVAVSGTTAVIGSGGVGTGSNSARAYYFDLSTCGAACTETSKLTGSDAGSSDAFSSSVAVSDAIAVAGAYLDNVEGIANSGSAYVFELEVVDPDSIDADAGPDQTQDEAVLVTLDGSGSTNATNYTWSQLAGPTVNLSSTTVVDPTFVTPYVSANTTLTFQLIVDDGAGNLSDPDTVDVTVVDVNTPPVADAGDDATIKEGVVATLDGGDSFDPDGDSPLGYTWTQTAGPIVELSPSDTVVSPSFTAPLGIGNALTFELIVDDGKEYSTPDDVVITVVENSPPVADAGPNQTVLEGTLVGLDGTASSDPDNGDTLTFDWTEPVVLDDDTSPTPSFTAPPVGSGGQDLTFDLVVIDDDPVNPKSSLPDQVTISVININDPPRCELARASCTDSKIKSNDGCTLWPPNHKLVSVRIEGVMDEDSIDNGVTLQIKRVTQDEPVNDGGDGDSSPDAVIQPSNPTDSVLIRTERAGGGNGRVYVVSFTADDGLESCTGSVSVSVPHDRKGTAVDDGQAHDSTQR